MQPQVKQLFISGVDTNTIQNGLESGEYYFRDGNGDALFYFNASHINCCNILKRYDGQEQVVSVKFVAPAQADPCDDCSGYRAGIRIKLRRGSPTSGVFDHETYLDMLTEKVFEYPFTGTSTDASVTAADVAASIIDSINATDAFQGGPLPYTAALDPADNNDETILITSEDGDISFDVYNLRDYPLNTIYEVTVPKARTLSDSYVKRKFSLGIGFIPGKDADITWQGCKNPVRIELCGCLPAGCSGTQYSETGNAVHLYQPGYAPFNLEIWVDGDDSGYANFITDLNAAITPDCTDVTPEDDEERQV